MTINPNNFSGATVTLVGYVAMEPAYPAYDKQGKHGFKEIKVAHNEGYKPKDGGDFVQTGTTWYAIKVHQDDLGNVGKGDKIRVDDAKQSTRTYTNKDGVEAIGILLEYGKITVLESKNGGASGGFDDEQPF